MSQGLVLPDPPKKENRRILNNIASLHSPRSSVLERISTLLLSVNHVNPGSTTETLRHTDDIVSCSYLESVMAARWFVNIIFLLFPIVVTLGVLFGIKADREASGQPPLFVDIDNGVTTSRYCQKSFGISSPSVGQGYTCKSNWP